jgi:hypothetical protein
MDGWAGTRIKHEQLLVFFVIRSYLDKQGSIMTGIATEPQRRAAPTKVTISPDKARQLRLPASPPHTVYTHTRLGLVFRPPNSPLYGELHLNGQFHTLGGVLSALRARMGGWQIEEPTIGRWSLELELISQRLLELQPSTIIQQDRGIAEQTVSRLSGVRDAHKLYARDLTQEGSRHIAAGHDTQLEASAWLYAGSQELKARAQIIAKMMKIDSKRAIALSETLESYLAYTTKMIALLEQSHQLDPVVAERQYRELTNRAVFKPWNFVLHQHAVNHTAGQRLTDRGYARRLRDCYLFEASVPRLLTPLNRLTNDPYARIAHNRHRTADTIDHTMLLLAGLEPLDAYAVLIDQVKSCLEAIAAILRTEPWREPAGVMLRPARQIAQDAKFLLRYRSEPHDPNYSYWYPVVS